MENYLTILSKSYTRL